MNLFQKSSALTVPPPPVVKANGAHAQSISTAVETITPEQAAIYLANRNEKNRSISKAATIKYARDMREGRWSLTGQPIIFDESGMLIDGHHRLTAAAEQGVTFQTLVIRGVASSAIQRIDGGRARTAAHMAAMAGTSSPVEKCAIMNLVLTHERSGIANMKSVDKGPTKSEIVDSLRTCNDLDSCVARAALTRKLISKAQGGFCYYVFRNQNPTLADRFWDDLSTGAGLSTTNPVLHLRNRLIDNATDKAKLPAIITIALMFKAWIEFRDGKKVKSLRWRTDGPQPEAFPEI